jgi:hypothetical protein
MYSAPGQPNPSQRITPVAKVYLEVVTTALRKLGLSEESITRGIFRGCGDGSLPYDHAGEAPPPGFWRTGLHNVKFNASDISNMLIAPANAEVAGFYTFTLTDVMLSWEAVVVKYPALRDIEPPELGTSRIEVSFAAPLMRWFETLVTQLWRKSPPSTVRLKEPTGWQAERVLRIMRTRLYPPDGRAPRSKELKQLEGEISAVLALEEKDKLRPKPAPSPEVVSTVVAFLGRRDG